VFSSLHLTSSLLFTLKMEAARSSETLVSYHVTHVVTTPKTTTCIVSSWCFPISGFLVVVAWRVFRLRMEKTASKYDMEGSCKYVE
jgi:hypothetical protein